MKRTATAVQETERTRRRRRREKMRLAVSSGFSLAHTHTRNSICSLRPTQRMSDLSPLTFDQFGGVFWVSAANQIIKLKLVVAARMEIAIVFPQ